MDQRQPEEQSTHDQPAEEDPEQDLALLDPEEEAINNFKEEDAALESSGLSFGVAVEPDETDTDTASDTASAIKQQHPSSKPMTVYSMKPWYSVRPKTTPAREEQEEEDAMISTNKDRLSKFDYLVVLPFYIACFVMAVLALTGSIFHSSSNGIVLTPTTRMNAQRKPNGRRLLQAMPTTFELYQDWDIASQLITAKEQEWLELVETHERLVGNSPSGAFYRDEMAVQQWLKSLGIPMASHDDKQKKHHLRREPKKKEWKVQATTKLDREQSSSSSLVVQFESESDDGWVVETTTELVGSLDDTLDESTQSERGLIAHDDSNGVLEFQCLTLWGRVYVVRLVQSPGTDKTTNTLVFRNGTDIIQSSATATISSIPSWVDWDHIIRTAEQLGEHKSMFQVDIRANVPPPTATKMVYHNSNHGNNYAVVRVDIVLSPSFYTNMVDYVWQEAARLLLEGYHNGDYTIVPNKELAAM